MRFSRRPVYKRRRRIAFLVFVLLLAALVLGGLRPHLSASTSEETSGLERVVVTPTVERAPEAIAEERTVEKKADEEKAANEEEEAKEEERAREEEKAAKEEAERAAAVAPEDPTLYLTVPKLGLYNHTVRNENSERALTLGAIKVPSTDFPWQKGDKNTYIGCHRLGFPGTESFNQCLNLPSMQKGDEVTLKDANGRAYGYRVSEILAVTSNDPWVMEAVAGRDMVSLQTCLETPNDFHTLGPNWEGRLVVRADRVS